MYKYGIIIYWSDEDQVYIAEVPELPGCVTHGETPNTALANANEAIELWIDTAKEFGNPVPEPKGQRLPVDSVESRGSQATIKQRSLTSLYSDVKYRVTRVGNESVRRNNPRVMSAKAPRPTANPEAQ